jgi:hypothetical protein
LVGADKDRDDSAAESPGGRERIRQDGGTFYRECPACRPRTVVFVNPVIL